MRDHGLIYALVWTRACRSCVKAATGAEQVPKQVHKCLVCGSHPEGQTMALLWNESLFFLLSPFMTLILCKIVCVSDTTSAFKWGDLVLGKVFIQSRVMYVCACAWGGDGQLSFLSRLYTDRRMCSTEKLLKGYSASKWKFCHELAWSRTITLRPLFVFGTQINTPSSPLSSVYTKTGSAVFPKVCFQGTKTLKQKLCRLNTSQKIYRLF